ncbi:DsbA family protein [Alteromonas sp. 14N.309.X.WAT.G.H12]|uniref:DsbA family protein n=1 Tax=Alteromonas sp. 14N.309.X.WAT.G.H12 TaxID=3120824 RepID=UPI002FD7771C
MLLNVKKGICIFTLMCLPGLSFADEYEPGVNYTVVSDSVNSKDTVTEYFSVYCGHCYAMELQGIPMLKKALRDDITLEQTPVNFMGFVSESSQNLMAKAFMAARDKEKGDAFLDLVFPQFHREKIDKPIAALAQVLDIDEADALDLVQDEEINKRFLKEVDAQNELLKRGLRGTPSFIVNGKYLVNMEELDNKAPFKDLVSLIKYLNGLV